MLEYARLFYETLGLKPRLFIGLSALVGAVIFSSVAWLIVTSSAHARMQTQSPPASTTTGSATTTGNESPAVTGNGNTVTVGEPPNSSKPKPEPPK
jgi:hypothetical protein